MMAGNAGRGEVELLSTESLELRHVMVNKHTFTKSRYLDAKHLEMFFKNRLSPSPINNCNKSISHSWFFSSISYGSFKVSAKLHHVNYASKKDVMTVVK